MHEIKKNTEDPHKTVPMDYSVTGKVALGEQEAGEGKGISIIGTHTK